MKRSLMLKSAIITSLLSSSLLFGSTDVDNKILKFEKRRISQNPRIKLKDIKLYLKKDINEGNWKGYVFDISLKLGKKDIKIKDIIF